MHVTVFPANNAVLHYSSTSITYLEASFINKQSLIIREHGATLYILTHILKQRTKLPPKINIIKAEMSS